MTESYWKDKNVLITGGAGFIGSSIAHELVASGAHVTVLDAMLPLYGGNLFNLDGIIDKIDFVQGDIRDMELVKKLVLGKDVIFSLAAQVSYIDSKTEPFLDLDINCFGHLNILEAVRELAPTCRVIFSSSRLVYGKLLTSPVSEDHPTNPLSIYGIHKLTVEKYYRYYHQTFGLDTLVVRIPNPYGPRQLMKHSKYSVVGWFMRQAIEGKTITIFGDGSQERDYLYIDDIVSAFVKIAEKGRSGEVYNIGTSERVTFGQMVDAIITEIKNGKRENIPWPDNYEKNETGSYIADTSKLRNDTDWSPEITLQEGIRKMAEYYLKHGNKYW
jgi:nucleoside-diphosphate-sugar epimerase